ncbi:MULTISPECIES: CopD family protein [Burkholderia]|uniref:CopD family protein n=1 Tax=Burkholderia TaxID=32008 RepID=UPI0008419F1F|nr:MULTISPECIES: CopD family protein [unclassified Burkholderia]AOK30530.1 copper resistance protein CopD [Burkholderia sp. Bp7605]
MKLDSLWLGQAALAALGDVAFAVAVGSALIGMWLAQDGATKVTAPSHPAWRQALRSLAVAAVVLVLADAGWLVYQAASMSGTGLVGAFGAIPAVLAQTHVGYAWSVACGGAMLFAVAAFVRPGGSLAGALYGLAALIVAAGKASLGHAADSGVFSAAIGVQIVHIAATAVWGGLVIAGGMAVLPAMRASVARGALIRIAQRLSGASAGAFAFVLVTGLLNAMRATDGMFASIDASPWGRVLLLKLALVALAAVLAALNRFSALPRLRRTASTEDAHTFNNVLHLEAVTMIGVFIAAAVLSSTAPIAAG